MVSMYHGVETGKSAISYFRKSMEVAGINTSKAKQEGYTRQVVASAAKPALSSGKSYSMLGTGVEITAIERMRDQFLDARLRRANVEQSYWATMQEGMSRVEKMVRGSNDVSMNNLLDELWKSIQDAHITPGEPAVRGVVLEQADSLVQFVETLSNDYTTYRTELNNDIRDMVEEANSLIDQIAVLNRGIRSLQNVGAEPNALLDERDLLVDKLSVLTGCTSTVSDRDQMDGDFKVMIDGRIVVQGTRTRHLLLVENEANSGYYDVQIEYNQYDVVNYVRHDGTTFTGVYYDEKNTSDPQVVGVIVEQRADDLRESNGTCTMDALHNIDVKRTADEMYWQVGHALSDKAGGQRITGLRADTALGAEGTFSLSVGSKGVRAYSRAYTDAPPGLGVILGDHDQTPGAPTSFTFRIAAGDFESTIKIEWDADDSKWVMTDNHGNTATLANDKEITVGDIAKFINDNYGVDGIVARDEDHALVIESNDRQLLSITDLAGSLMTEAGLANEGPIVKISVGKDDTLQSIANKINNAYMFDKIVQIEGEGEDATEKRLLFYDTIPADTAPSSPEQWMHASVEQDEDGEYYLLLTSNVAGEEARINVMSGSVCGDGVNDMTVARLLGLVEDGYNNTATGVEWEGKDLTSYVQVDASTGGVKDRYYRRVDENGSAWRDDVFVDDAYVILDGRKEFLSSGNVYRDARLIAAVGNAPADELTEFSPGLRVEIRDIGESDIIIRHHLIEGQIYSAVKLRDDVLLSHTDVFDNMMYELATQFNAIHYAGYGMEEYADVTGMKFFEEIKGRYGAFSKLKVDSALISDDGFDHSRFAAMSGDGSGHAIGDGDGSNALAMAQLKQMKLFMGETADFNTVYMDFVTQYASFGARSKTMLGNIDHIAEQIQNERSSVMDVNIDEEMLTLTQMNQQFNYTSQYLTTLLSVMDQIISGMGRVGL